MFRGSQENLVYGDNTIEELYGDSGGEDEQRIDSEFRRRVVDAVEEGDELVSHTMSGVYQCKRLC